MKPFHPVNMLSQATNDNHSRHLQDLESLRLILRFTAFQKPGFSVLIKPAPVCDVSGSFAWLNVGASASSDSCSMNWFSNDTKSPSVESCSRACRFIRCRARSAAASKPPGRERGAKALKLTTGGFMLMVVNVDSKNTSKFIGLRILVTNAVLPQVIQALSILLEEGVIRPRGAMM